MQLRNKGFSLPEITVALGLVAGISLVTIKMMENQSNNELRIKFHAEVQKATGKIKAAMSDPEACRYMLKNKIIGTYAAPTIFGSGANDKLFARVKNHLAGTYSQIELIRPNTKYQGFKTGDIALRYPQVSNVPSVAELVITYKMENKSLLFDDRDDTNDRRTVKQVIPLIVKQSANIISDCGPAVSDTNEVAREKFCKSLGALAQWYPAVGATPSNCKFQEVKCNYGFVPEYQNSTGTINCVSIENQLDPNQLFDQTPCNIQASKKFMIVANGAGRLKVQCLP